MQRASAYPAKSSRRFAAHGWVGLALIAIFWTLNWTLPGPRTQWAFFPLWLGFCLIVDALVLVRRGTSLLNRNWRKYVVLFLISAPVWWIFEVINWRLQNWSYNGSELFTPFQFWFYATLNFTVVIPAVFGSAELAGSFAWVRRLGRWRAARLDRVTTTLFFVTGLVMFALMWAWPQYFFPFVWISVYFILEPINIWMGFRSLSDWLREGDWRPVVSLWLGVLITAFFWEMWNYLSYPKWVYHVPWGNGFHVFEMPLLGYGGYLPFALELFAIYHFVTGLFGSRNDRYVEIGEEDQS